MAGATKTSTENLNIVNSFDPADITRTAMAELIFMSDTIITKIHNFKLLPLQLCGETRLDLSESMSRLYPNFKQEKRL